MGSFVDIERMKYAELGFDTLPLIPGSKKAFPRSWQVRTPYRLWQNAPDGANIGIRGGGLASVAFIDCDEPRTFENVTNWLSGLGLEAGTYPIVQTASGAGWHIYASFAGGLAGDWCILSNEIGTGEFRFGAGSYVVAPPSVISDGGGYTLISGSFARLPNLDLMDVLKIVGNQENQQAPKRTIPRKAVAMLNGKGFDGYKTKSEAEQALITILINAGFTFTDVLHLFNHHPCAGKYAEMKAQNTNSAEYWLSRSYSEAMQWAATHESKARKTARAAIEWADSSPWPGRTGAVDWRVFLAHATIAFKAGRTIYAAACRDLAELAAVSHTTATRSTHRLCNSDLLILETPATVDSASQYRFGQALDKSLHSLKAPSVRKWNTLSAVHDVFRVGGLGTSAGQVWQVLQDVPATVDELAAQTGRHRKTIERTLARMVNIADPLTGEYLPLVASSEGETWHILQVDLDYIAQVIGTAGAGEKQKQAHEKERQIHQNALYLGKMKKDNQPPSGDIEKV